MGNKISSSIMEHNITEFKSKHTSVAFDNLEQAIAHKEWLVNDVQTGLHLRKNLFGFVDL